MITALLNASAVSIPLMDRSVDCIVTSPPYWGLRMYPDLPLTDWPPVTYLPVTGASPITVDAWCGHLGLETTPNAYIGHMILIFRELHRVLKDRGTIWLNMGDSYIGSGGSHKPYHKNTSGFQYRNEQRELRKKQSAHKAGNGLKPKDLAGVPWRLALALQADGWWLRSDIVWHKAGCVPESVKDRPTRAHEYIFLLAKSRRYYYNHEAIKEPTMDRQGRILGGTRNKRSVWFFSTSKYRGGHLATFPLSLVEPCIKAGCPPDGIVLDPFAGSGTTLLAARALSRRSIGLDLSLTFLHGSAERLDLNRLGKWGKPPRNQDKEDNLRGLPLFDQPVQ